MVALMDHRFGDEGVDWVEDLEADNVKYMDLSDVYDMPDGYQIIFQIISSQLSSCVRTFLCTSQRRPRSFATISSPVSQLTSLLATQKIYISTRTLAALALSIDPQ